MLLATVLPAHGHISRNMFMIYNLNTDNGLSSPRVYSIVEAEDGAMWISTKRGVDRYNANWFLITHWLQKCNTVMPVAEISNWPKIIIGRYMPTTTREKYIYIIR